MAQDKESLQENEPRWAWLALLGCCYIRWVFGGVFRCMGIFYVSIMETFNSTPFETSLFPVTNMLVGMIAVPVAGIASDRFSMRTVLGVTSVTGAAGFVAAAFAPNLWSFILCYALLTGFSLSAIALAVTVNVTRMFRRHRSFANGCLFASSSIGGMVMPPVYAYLLDLYTIRGAFIIIGGLMFQQLVVAAMLNPQKVQEVHRKAAETAKAMKKVSSTPKFTMHSEFDTHKELTNSEQDDKHPKQRKTDSASVKDEENSLPSSTEKSRSEPVSGEEKTESPHVKEDGYKIHAAVKQTTDEGDKTGCVKHTTDIPGTNMINNDKYDVETLPPIEKTEDEKRAKQENPESSVNGAISMETKQESIEQDSKPNKTKKKSLKVDVKEILKMGLFWGLFFSTMFLNIGMRNTGLFMPAYAEERGIPLVEYSLLISAGGGVSLLCNIFYGYIGDRSCTNLYLLSGMLTMTCGALIHVLSYMTNRYAVYALTFCLRIFGGAHMMYSAPMVIAAVGGGRTGTALGLIRSPGRLAVAAAQLAFGSYREVTGSYADVIRLASFFYIAGGALFVLMSSTRMQNKIRKAFRSNIYVIN